MKRIQYFIICSTVNCIVVNIKAMKFLVISAVFCAAVLVATAEKQHPNEQNIQLSPSNLPVNLNNAKSAQGTPQTASGPVPSNLVDVKRIVDRVSTHLPRIFTWRSWNHWLDSNTNVSKMMIVVH